MRTLLAIIFCVTHVVNANLKLLPQTTADSLRASFRQYTPAFLSIAAPLSVRAQSDFRLTPNDCDDDRFLKKIFNIPPTEIFYPTFLEGQWTTDFRLLGATFTDKISLQQLGSDVNVAGFRKYSVAFLPDLGSEFTTTLSFRKDSRGKILEDRAANLKNLIEASMKRSSCIVDAVEYDPSSNANRCTIKYHDAKGDGRLEVFTNSRLQQATSNSFNTFETVRQSSIRFNTGQRASQIYVDYGMEWNFVLDQQSEKSPLTSTLKIVSYLIPQDGLYFIRPDRPVGVFTYDVKMSRI